MELIAQGAEAKIFLDGDKIIKERISKSYRHSEIDEKLRKSRTRREAKVLKKLEEMNFPGPKLNDFCDKSMKISMDFLKGQKLRDVIDENPDQAVELAKEIGRNVGRLHKENIVHMDLTTSNMILLDEIHFIDFGLSFFSLKPEDKAVDLHLLERAFESRHHKVFEECRKAFSQGYAEEYDDAEVVLKRLDVVKGRGRNKAKVKNKNLQK